MNREKLVRHLRRHGCILLREGGRHSVFENPATSDIAAVPRHREIGNNTVRDICDQLGVPQPPSRS